MEDIVKELDKALENMKGQLVSIDYETKRFTPFYHEVYFLGFTDYEGIHIGSDAFTSCITWEYVEDIVVKIFGDNIGFTVYMDDESVVRVSNGE
jgi:hypothetical protein